MEILESISMKDTNSGVVTFVLDAEGGLDMKQMLLDTGYTEEDIQDAIDSGEIEEDYLDLTISISMDFEIEATEDYSHVVGTLDMEAMGEAEIKNYESYVDNSNDEYSITYEYDEFWEEWTSTKEYNDEEAEDITEDIDMIFDYIKNAEIVSETDDVYVLDVELDLYQLYLDESDMVDDLVEDSETNIEATIGDIADLVEALDSMSITVEVDKENNYLAAIRVDFASVVDSLLAVIPETEDGVNYADYITVDTLSFDVEISDVNDVVVEIPQDVIDEAGEVTEDDDEDWDDFDDDDDLDDIEDDEDSNVINSDGTVNLHNYYGDVIAILNVPAGYEIDADFSDDTIIKFENDYSNVYAQNFVEDWAEDLYNGIAYEPNLEVYTRDEAKELESIETDFGTARVFVNTYSFSSDFNEVYEEYIVYIFEEDGEILFSVDGDLDEIKESGYTAETFIQAVFDK